MVVLLAAGAALSFGALAVTIRLALQPPLDAEAASLVTTFLAGVFCVVLAVVTGDLTGFDWVDTWPFFVTGLFAPGISQILFTRAVGVIGPSRTAVFVGVSPVLSAAIAVTLLSEPVHVALVLGTLLVVAGGTLLVRERRPAGRPALARHRDGARRGTALRDSRQPRALGARAEATSRASSRRAPRSRPPRS